MACYEPFIGSVNDFAGNFAPKGWAFCMGQHLPIQQNAALFSILGTTYGGNGVTDFALPDLRPVVDGQRVMWQQLDDPVPAKIIALFGVFPSRE